MCKSEEEWLIGTCNVIGNVHILSVPHVMELFGQKTVVLLGTPEYPDRYILLAGGKGGTFFKYILTI